MLMGEETSARNEIQYAKTTGEVTPFSIPVFTESRMPNGFFLRRSPRRWVLAAGVEVKAGFHDLQTGLRESKMLWNKGNST
jgi:hypothetical protein